MSGRYHNIDDDVKTFPAAESISWLEDVTSCSSVSPVELFKNRRRVDIEKICTNYKRNRRWLMDGSLQHQTRLISRLISRETTLVEQSLLLFGTYYSYAIRSAFSWTFPLVISVCVSIFMIFSPWKFLVPFCCLLTRVYDSTRFLERTSFHSCPFTFSRNRAIQNTDCCLLEKWGFFRLMEFRYCHRET